MANTMKGSGEPLNSHNDNLTAEKSAVNTSGTQCEHDVTTDRNDTVDLRDTIIAHYRITVSQMQHENEQLLKSLCLAGKSDGLIKPEDEANIQHIGLFQPELVMLLRQLAEIADRLLLHKAKKKGEAYDTYFKEAFNGLNDAAFGISVLAGHELLQSVYYRGYGDH